MYTKERGFLAYYEVCKREKTPGWMVTRDAAGGPYMHKGNQWIGWDDVNYITKKVRQRTHLTLCSTVISIPMNLQA